MTLHDTLGSEPLVALGTGQEVWMGGGAAGKGSHRVDNGERGAGTHRLLPRRTESLGCPTPFCSGPTAV